jgi:hypothetical protein
MTKVILYKQNNGVPAIVVPTLECLQTHTIVEIAIKDVPSGKKFKIVDVAEFSGLEDIPQEAWEVAEEDLTDGVGGDSNEFN